MKMMHSFDSRLEHRAVGSAALTATTTLDTLDLTAETRTSMVTRVIVEACKISANDELYTLVIEGATDSGYTTVQNLATADFGATEVRAGGAIDTAVGDIRDIYWTNEVADITYQHVRIRLITTGTSETMTLGVFSAPLRGAI